MAELFANSEAPDQTPHFAASDLGLHCLPTRVLGFSRLKWVNYMRWKMSVIWHKNIQNGVKRIKKVVHLGREKV